MRTRLALAALAIAVLGGVVVHRVLPGPSPPLDPGPMPPPDDGAVTILFFGDSGTGAPPQQRVADGMFEVCRRLSCDFGLMLGDNVYAGRRLRGPADPVLEQSLGRPYAAFGQLEGFVLWAVMGNHDVLAGLEAEFAYAARHPLWQQTELVFAVPDLPDWLHLFGLFTPPLFKAEGTLRVADPAADWQGQLRRAEAFFCDESRRGWKILFGHHPLYSSAHGTARRLESRLLPVIRRCGVDLYLAGHAHQQEHIHTRDFEQFVQGAASSPRPARGWLTRAPSPRFLSEQPGFGVLRVSERRVRVDFFDAQGRRIYSWQAGRPGVGAAGRGMSTPALDRWNARWARANHFASIDSLPSR